MSCESSRHYGTGVVLWSHHQRKLYVVDSLEGKENYLISLSKSEEGVCAGAERG